MKLNLDKYRWYRRLRTLSWWQVKGMVKCRFMGHRPIPDQCGMPEHDFCERCDKRLPYSWSLPPEELPDGRVFQPER